MIEGHFTVPRRTALAALGSTFLAGRGSFVAAREGFVLRPGIPVVLEEAEPMPVKKAAVDLCRDLEKVFGRPSPLRSKPPAEGLYLLVSSGAGSATRQTLLANEGPEAHALRVVESRVELLGADVRGAVYAVYAFSEEILGVSPWWFWNRTEPYRQESIVLPDTFTRVWPSPKVRWRGWFPNDTDLFTPWILKDYEPRWNTVLETMLRLKLNLLDIGEFYDDTLRKIRVPRDRGLALTTTHMAPFGASLRNWGRFWKDRKEPVPALRLDATEELETFWSHHLRLVEKEGAEMVWTIGFRGDADRGFHRTFEGAPDDRAGRAAVVESMMRRQLELLRGVESQREAPARWFLYDEVSDYVADGLIKLPADGKTIWNFCAARRDHFPAEDVVGRSFPDGQPVGYYFNVQFTNSGSHLADGEGPWKLEQNHRLLARSGGKLELGIANCGNVREFQFSLEAHARLLWDPDGYDTDSFLEQFAIREAGPEHAPGTVALYREFYDAYWIQKPAVLPDLPRQFLFHDLRIARATRELLKAATEVKARESLLDERESGFYRIETDAGTIESKVEALIAGMKRSSEAFAAVAANGRELVEALPQDRRAFLREGLLRQAEFMSAASLCLLASAEGYQGRSNGKTYIEAMGRALEAVERMERALDDKEEVTFGGWYGSETIFGIAETRAMIERRVKGEVKPLA